MDSVQYLLESLLETIEEQIEAAKKLNTDALSVATERRQDLLFELEVERNERYFESTEELVALKEEIDVADQRLMSILETVVDITKSMEAKESFYSKKGNLEKT
jgi:hypothetical protein